jgi:polyhydroxyalkanoate synthesis regulator phasin
MAADARRYSSDARRYIEAALGNLTPSGARDVARSVVEQAQGLAGQGPSAMAGQIRDMGQQIMDWSQQGRSQILETIQREVRKQLKAFGLATTDDIDALRKRVRELEKAVGGATSTRKSPAKRPTAKKRTTAKSTSGRTSAGSRSSSSSPASSASEGSGSSGSEGPSGSTEAGGATGGSGSGGDGA